MKNWPNMFVAIAACWLPANNALASLQNPTLPGAPFIKNEGQLDSSVSFYSKLFHGDVYITKKGQMVYSLPGKKHDTKTLSAHRAFITEELLNAHPVEPVAYKPSITRVSYLHGSNPETWQSNQATYDSILMPRVWDKIDLELKAYQKNVEKLFTLQPGAKASDIQLKLSGTQKIEIDPSGALLASTELGIISFTPPIAWQTIEGKKETVNVHYQLNTEQTQSYGFAVGDYNTEHALYIDPLLQSTFLGGSGSDRGNAIAIATNGDVYITGKTWISTSATNDFPGTAGGVDEVSFGDEVFVARLSGDLKTLYQATYLGGSQSETAYDIALATNGDVILVGETHSADFPGVSGGLDESLTGTWDGFVARLDPALTSLVQSTYLGGGSDDHAWALLLEADGQILIAGESNSPDFPGVSGGAYSTPNNSDTFLTRLSGDLQTVSQSTFYGGSNSERPYGLERGSNGDLYLAGYTDSADLTDIAGGALTSHAGYNDGFIVQIAPDLKSVKQATYLGGTAASGEKSSETIIRALSIAANGDVYVGGETNSDQIPGINGGAITSYNHGFISQLDADLTEFKQSTYIGGTNPGGDVYGLAFSNGDLLVIGDASGDGAGFPAISGGDDTSASGDAYLTRLASNLTTFKQSTFIGGDEGWEEANDIAVTSSGMVYVAGTTTSKDFNKIEGGADTTFVTPDQGEAFIAMFDSLTATNSTPDTECSFFILKAGNGHSAIICL